MALDKNVQIKIDAAVNSAAAAENIGDIRRALKDLQSLAIEYADTNTEAFNEVTTAAGVLKDKVADAKAAISAVSGEPIENLAGSFKLAASSLASMDFGQASSALKLFTANIKALNPSDLSEKLKTLTADFKAAGDAIIEKFPKAGTTVAGLTNVVSGLGKTAISALGGDFRGAISGVGTAFQGLGQIIKANPLLLLATIVIELVTHFNELKKVGGLLGNTLTAIGAIVSTITGLFTKLTDAIGLTNIAGQKASEEAIKNYDAQIKKTDEATEAALRLAKARGAKPNEIFDISDKGLDEKIEQARKKVEEASNRLKKGTNGVPFADRFQNKEDLDAYEQANAELKKYLDDRTALYDEQALRVKELNQKTRDEIKRNNAETIQDETRKNLELSKIDREKALRDARELELSAADKANLLASINAKYDAIDTKTRQDAAKKRKEEADQERQKAQQIAAHQAQEDLKILEEQGKNILKLDDQNNIQRLEKLANSIQEQVKFIEANAEKLYPGLTKEQRAAKVKAEQDARYAELFKAQQDFDKYREDQYAKEQEQQEKVRELKKQALQLEAQDRLDLLGAQSAFDTGQAERNPTLANMLKAIETEALYKQAALDAGYQREMEAAEKIGADTLAIKQRYNLLELENTKKTEQAKYRARLESTQRGLAVAQAATNALSALNDLITQNENNNLKKGEKASIEVQRRQFNRQKALGVTNAVISTASAVAAALGPPNVAPYSFIVAGLTAAAGALQIATIASQKFNPDASGSDSGTAAPIGGLPGIGAQEAQVPSAPNLSGLGNTSNKDIGTGRVYVVESDITDAQGRVRIARDNSRLGN